MKAMVTINVAILDFFPLKLKRIDPKTRRPNNGFKWRKIEAREAVSTS